MSRTLNPSPTGLWANPILREDMEYIRARLGDAQKFSGATVLITGAAGFLGFYISHFFQHLAENGVDIRSLILLDRFMFGKPAWLEKLAAANPRIQVHAFDISTDSLEKITGAKQADFVIHMASIASPIFYRQHPLETIDANIWGLRRLLDFYRGGQLKGLLFFSSSEIYGDPSADKIPTCEDFRGYVSCQGPRACYDESKRFGETLCYVFSTKYNLPARLVRPFNNYGPGMSLNDQRAPADFAKNVLEGRDLVLLSSGSPTRTFCYVADAITGYLKMLLHDQFDVVNIGIEKPEITIQQLAETYQRAARQVMDYSGRIVKQTSPDKEYLTNNPERRCPDISKARRLLDYQPEILVDAGVEKFLKFLWFEHQNRA